MTRRLRLSQIQGSNRIISIVVAALLLLGIGGIGVSRLVQSQGADPAPTATPLTIAVKDPPAASPAAASPAATPAKVAEAPEPACKVADAKSVGTVPQGYAAPGEAYVFDDAVNMRAGPSTDCKVVGTLAKGDVVTIHNGLQKSGDYYWRRVTTKKGGGYTIASAFRNGAAPKQAASNPAFVEVLMYHHIAEGSDNLHVSPDDFAQQVAWLHDNGYETITPDELYKALYEGGKLPAKPIMLTIDDGNPSSETFKQILDQYGYKGVYFLPDYAELTDDQIRELDKDGQVCGHTVSHQFLGKLSYDDQYYQIMHNKDWLEKILGHPVTCFAYPFGSYNDTTDKIMASSGYTIAFDATGGGQKINAGVDQYHILRKEIDPVFSLDTFAKIVDGGW